MRAKFSQLISASSVDFFLEGTRYYKTYVDLIDQARTSIHLQTYIFEMDAFGKQVHAALLRAAARQVEIFLLVDSVGSKNFPSESTKELSMAGVHVGRFNGINLRWFYQWGRRLHHKILLVDHKQGMVGGINVTTSGYGIAGSAQQLDFAVLLKGEVIQEISDYCEFTFHKACEYIFPPRAVLDVSDKKINLRVSINDWVYRRWQITQQYSRLTKTAQKEITIINSYFFPRRRIMRRLAAAAARGVRVRLILPKLSDWPSYILASQYLYSYFLKRGVEIYEWKKSILHGKLATVDSEFSTIGSYNLNYTSYQQNLEMNIDFYSATFTTHLNESIDELIRVGCERVEARKFTEEAGVKTKVLRFFYYILLSVIANFSVLLTYQEESPGLRRNKYINLFCIIAALVCFFFRSDRIPSSDRTRISVFCN